MALAPAMYLHNPSFWRANQGSRKSDAATWLNSLPWEFAADDVANAQLKFHEVKTADPGIVELDCVGDEYFCDSLTNGLLWDGEELFRACFLAVHSIYHLISALSCQHPPAMALKYAFVLIQGLHSVKIMPHQ